MHHLLRGSLIRGLAVHVSLVGRRPALSFSSPLVPFALVDLRLVAIVAPLGTWREFLPTCGFFDRQAEHLSGTLS